MTRKDRERACEGKVKHATEAMARAVAHRYRVPGQVRQMNAYRCRYCKSWHVGHEFGAELRLWRGGAGFSGEMVAHVRHALRLKEYGWDDAGPAGEGAECDVCQGRLKR